MKDAKDKQTGNLLMSNNSIRQARFREAQLKLGRSQRQLWLTEEEALLVRAYVAQIRNEKVE